MALDFLQAYLLTVFIETIILYIILRKRYNNYIIVRNSILVNTITLPVVWFFFPSLLVGHTVQTIVAEFFAFFTEAVLYVWLFKKLRFFDAASISFICNFLSFIFGIILQLAT